MISIDILLTETELATAFVRGFTEKKIPEKFFYWFPLSVHAWLNLCRDGAYRNFVRSRDLIREAAEPLVQKLPRSLEIVSLGSGQGDKDRLLLRAARTSGCDILYVPVDASQALLEMACEGAAQEGIPAHGVKLDLEDDSHLRALPVPNRARLFALLGNTLGAFDPRRLLSSLRAIARDGDFFLMDGELFSNESMAGYDNPTNRRFAFAPLASVGIRESDGALRFETRTDPRFEGLYYFPKHFEPARDLDLTLAGEPVRLERGARVEMNFSYKYSRSGFLRLVQDEGRLEILEELLSADERFLMVLARPR